MSSSRPVIEKSNKRRKEFAPRDLAGTRIRIFEAAKVLFAQNTYEGVGVRDIARDAGVDPALVVRYFGSKEELFREIADQAFGVEEFIRGGVAMVAENAERVLMSDVDERRWRSGFDPLRFLLASIGSPTGGPILARALDRDFVRPISAAIGGAEAAERGVALAAWIVGFALMRIVSSDRQVASTDGETLRRLFTALVRDVVNLPHEAGRSSIVSCERQERRRSD
jgi:AcrR family transcriptional regulator